MRLPRGRGREPGTKSVDLIQPEPEKNSFKPEDVLGPKFIEDTLSVRRALEIQLAIGDTFTPAIQLSTLVKMTIPEKINWPPEPKNLLRTQEKLDQIAAIIGHQEPDQLNEIRITLMELMALVVYNPEAARQALGPVADKVAEGVEILLGKDLLFFSLSVATALYLAAPAYRERVQQAVRSNLPHLLGEIKKDNLWHMAAYIFLICPELKDEFEVPPEVIQELAQKTKTLAIQAGGRRFDGDAKPWAWPLELSFELAALTASSVKLNDDGTVEYTFTPKIRAHSPLPERPLTT